jgi:hypothetical protein
VPVKRRVPKRRLAELPDACFRYLADLLDPALPWPDEVVGLVYFDDPLPVEEAWAKHGAEAVAAHQAERGPGSYPELWWRFNAPDGGDGADPGGGGLPRAA